MWMRHVGVRICVRHVNIIYFGVFVLPMYWTPTQHPFWSTCASWTPICYKLYCALAALEFICIVDQVVLILKVGWLVESCWRMSSIYLWANNISCIVFYYQIHLWSSTVILGWLTLWQFIYPIIYIYGLQSFKVH